MYSGSIGSTPQWFATQVWAGREQLSVKHLAMRGYETFLPCYRENHRWSDRVKTVERALFAGYVFCRVTSDVVGAIMTTPGVIRVVGDGTRFLPVANEEIAVLQRVMESGLNAEPWEYLQIGDPVKVIAGPLCDTEGIVVRVKNECRLIISVTLLQRSVAVEIDAALVEPLAGSGRPAAWQTEWCRARARDVHTATASPGQSGDAAAE